MQANIRQQHTASHLVIQPVPHYVTAELDDRRRELRSKRETELVTYFTPGQIPTLQRLPEVEGLARAIDIVGATVGLILFGPALLLSMLAIKLTSRGPVFFVQLRVGAGGRLFRMYKLRTMVTEAEKLQADLLQKNEMDGPVFKIQRDPRITAVGRLLRKLSLDEVPQFINVLRGEMSLVGPRPPLAKEVKKYKRWQLQRLTVKPGMTGLWQVSGRNRINFDEWVRLDIRYIRQRSLWFDLKIMVQTFKVIFIRPDGA